MIDLAALKQRRADGYSLAPEQVDALIAELEDARTRLAPEWEMYSYMDRTWHDWSDDEPRSPDYQGLEWWVVAEKRPGKMSYQEGKYLKKEDAEVVLERCRREGSKTWKRDRDV